MMGRTHARSGLVVALAAYPLLPVEHTPTALALGLVAAAGGAMLPDLDHPSATIAHTFGLPTVTLSHIVAKLTGGHRGGTHSLVGVGGFVGVSLAAQHAGGWVLLVWLTLLLGVGLTGLGLVRREHRILFGLAITVGVAVLVRSTLFLGLAPATIPWAVGLGAAAHVAGDCLTPQRCPLLWPLRRRYGVGLVKTEGWVEVGIVNPLLLVVAAGLGLAIFGSTPGLR